MSKNGKLEEASHGDKDEHEIEFRDIFQNLNNPVNFERDLLIPANANGIDDVVRIANGGKSTSAVSSTIGTLIDQGKIGVISHNGVIQVVGPGRYYLPNPRAHWEDIYSLTDNVITVESLSIVRVQRGEVGLAVQNGQPRLLGEGIHVVNDRLFEFKRCETLNQQYLHHGSIHVIRVPKGSYGLITEDNVPKLLQEGIHATNSNVFKFDGMQLMNQPYLKHGTIHILRVPKGQIALVVDDNKPKLLEGTHCINSKTFTYKSMEILNQPVIRHGTITQFQVRKGELGLAWENNNPAFFEEGIYYKDNPQFVFEKCLTTGQKDIDFGSKKIITVWDGEVGISYLKGKLIVLKPDRHVIDNKEHIFSGFLSTQQQCLHLYNAKHADDGFLSCETKDFVEIGLKADVFYKIVDAEKVLLVVGKDKVAALVKETAIATLNSIIRSTSLAEVAQNKEVAPKQKKTTTDNNTEEEVKGPQFTDRVHDEFIGKLHDSFLENFGISITNIRIQDQKIMDEELQLNISKQAFTTAQTETQLSNLAGQTEIATAQMKRDAEVARIQAEGQAIKLRTEVEAKNKSVLESAKAMADATVIKARADAQAVQLRAEAEAKAIILKAEAEAKQAEMLNSTPLGGQLQMYEMYSQMVKASISGVKKVIYMPTDAMNNPLSFLNMQQGVIPGFSPANAKK